ncbi:hypothetical protein J007_04111 [Cryptococcus neoformans]|nr:hypothetical protein J007_04111 [Cryptococcus neoformans var. grubii]OXC60333.1 hypothetical protein C358_04226 [Cryptococcus neoformans var. grubii MW-RSA852]
MPGLLLPRRLHESPIRLRLTVHEYAERETSEIVEDHSVYVSRGVGRPHKELDADLLAEPIEIFESIIKDIHQEKRAKDATMAGLDGNLITLGLFAIFCLAGAL